MPIDWGLPNFNAYRRTLNAYEQLQYPALGNYRGVRTNERQLRAWLMRGAVREDDLRQSSYEEHEPRPEVDPHGEFTRVFHHFYDPIHDQPLAPLISCFFLPGALAEGCLPATDWALGAVNVANQPTASASTGRRNHFSWADGREALWCALTHKPEPNAPEENAGDRRICWATAIKSLGHVLHLLQDSAQPQHVRNDVHNPPNAS